MGHLELMGQFPWDCDRELVQTTSAHLESAMLRLAEYQECSFSVGQSRVVRPADPVLGPAIDRELEGLTTR
jgi:hypothetical protein